MKRGGWSTALINVVSVTLWHVLAMLAGLSQAAAGSFAALQLTSLVLSILRLLTRSLVLPNAAHFAIDIF